MRFIPEEKNGNVCKNRKNVCIFSKNVRKNQKNVCGNRKNVNIPLFCVPLEARRIFAQDQDAEKDQKKIAFFEKKLPN